ncbi:DUF916 and DUF3324 domain-containing protein [Candidatus Enterococcus mansonii]|uniref:Uncharacterized protein n=1 Tax=Candidatus Enterococcus mansonii TaxID=1834181 RepID=A0A242CI40_9ENTE|nr:DUF916 and DUF3324 domain-containing protein [Enterococcus sp. 4G2_DIV0659]OTO09829.1 hypothetical protein A5880_000512 [Enterococcus sp. 4G2_DIV0659]
MKKKYLVLLSLIAVFMSVTIGKYVTYAEENQKSEDDKILSAGGFTYNVIYPENQIGGESGYFDLKMTPGQSQTVEIKLLNLGEEEIKIHVGLTGAKTNPNGVIDYGGNEAFTYDNSLKYKFEDIVKAPKEVVLAGKKEEILKIDINMPKTSYDGSILGGISLQKDTNEKDEAAKKASGTTVVNQFAYVTGIVLRETEAEIKSELGFNKVAANNPDRRNSIVIDLGNRKPKIMNDVTVEAQIMGEKSDEVLYEAKQTGISMAPNTVFNFFVDMEGQPMEVGKYRAHILASSGADKWEWTEAFEITKEEADKFNKEAVGLIQERGFDWKLVAMIAGGIIVLVIVVFLGIKFVLGRNNKAKNAAKKAKRKKVKAK